MMLVEHCEFDRNSLRQLMLCCGTLCVLELFRCTLTFLSSQPGDGRKLHLFSSLGHCHPPAPCAEFGLSPELESRVSGTYSDVLPCFAMPCSRRCSAPILLLEAECG